jgi:hypothetical protein
LRVGIAILAMPIAVAGILGYFGQRGGIQIEAATYGQQCGASTGNTTRDVKLVCEGKRSCDYKVNYIRLGDPAPGCSKDFSLTWRCRADGQMRSLSLPPEAGFGSIAALRCDDN